MIRWSVLFRRGDNPVPCFVTCNIFNRETIHSVSIEFSRKEDPPVHSTLRFGRYAHVARSFPRGVLIEETVCEPAFAALFRDVETINYEYLHFDRVVQTKIIGGFRGCYYFRTTTLTYYSLV